MIHWWRFCVQQSRNFMDTRMNVKNIRKRLLGPFPHLMTACSLFFGIQAFWWAMVCHNIFMWILCLSLSVLFDGVDGYLARRMGMSGGMGTILDSLSDFVSFGVGPSVSLFVLLSQKNTQPFVVHILLLAACGYYIWSSAWRLARFSLDEHRDISSGIPTPGGAMLLIAPYVVMHHYIGPSFLGTPTTGIYACYTMLLGVALCSRVPTPIVKKRNRPYLFWIIGGMFFVWILAHMNGYKKIMGVYELVLLCVLYYIKRLSDALWKKNTR